MFAEEICDKSVHFISNIVLTLNMILSSYSELYQYSTPHKLNCVISPNFYNPILHSFSKESPHSFYTSHMFLIFCTNKRCITIVTLPRTDIPHGPHAFSILHAELFSKLEGHVSRSNAFFNIHYQREFFVF